MKNLIVWFKTFITLFKISWIHSSPVEPISSLPFSSQHPFDFRQQAVAVQNATSGPGKDGSNYKSLEDKVFEARQNNPFKFTSEFTPINNAQPAQNSSRKPPAMLQDKRDLKNINNMQNSYSTLSGITIPNHLSKGMQLHEYVKRHQFLEMALADINSNIKDGDLAKASDKARALADMLDKMDLNSK
jgi:hypothetical protein